MTEKTYFTGIAILFAFGAVVRGAVTILSNDPIDPQPAVEYRAVCSNLPANAHRNGSGGKDDGTRKEIPQTQGPQNVRGHSPVGTYNASGSDTGCYFICDDGYVREDGFCVRWEFDYTGSSQTFTAPKDGQYQIELRGAQGSNTTYVSSSYSGGKGAYTRGEIYLTSGTQLYVYIGPAGGTPINDTSRSFNGGGHTHNPASYYGNGGGATDVRLISGAWDDDTSLRSRIMVAAGGASAQKIYSGGDGGALTGFQARPDLESLNATQTGPTPAQRVGVKGGFGKGDRGDSGRSYGGAGGGYWGGVQLRTSSCSEQCTAGGGSSFISGYTGAVAVSATSTDPNKSGCEDGTTEVECSYHYSGKIFSGAVMIAGNQSMPNPRGGGNITGNSGDGYAKITFLN